MDGQVPRCTGDRIVWQAGRCHDSTRSGHPACAAARGSERLHAWLLGHRRFGPIIRYWQAGGAIGRRAKWLATGMMAAAAVVMFLTAPEWWMAATGTAVMAVVGAWLWHRPEPPR